MKRLKNKFLIILVIVIIVILISGFSVYATYKYLASDVNYTKTNGETVSVESALNDLYEKNNKVILSINQTVTLTTDYTSTTIPNYYDNTVLSYNSENNTYTFLKDFSGKLYIAQGWIQGVTGSKMNVQINDSYIISQHHFENNTSAFNYSYEFKQGDILKIYSRFDCVSSVAIPVSIDLIRNY